MKILMFMFSAFCATVFAACQVLEFGSAAADRGLLKEFEAIIAVVIGGTLLTGGYGTVLGARSARSSSASFSRACSSLAWTVRFSVCSSA